MPFTVWANRLDAAPVLMPSLDFWKAVSSHDFFSLSSQHCSRGVGPCPWFLQNASEDTEGAKPQQESNTEHWATRVWLTGVSDKRPRRGPWTGSCLPFLHLYAPVCMQGESISVSRWKKIGGWIQWSQKNLSNRHLVARGQEPQSCCTF